MKFTTTIQGSGNKASIEVPENIVNALDAGRRPPVVVTINDGQRIRIITSGNAVERKRFRKASDLLLSGRNR